MITIQKQPQKYLVCYTEILLYSKEKKNRSKNSDIQKNIKISFVVLLHVSSNKLHRKSNQVATYYNANTFKFIIRKYYPYTLIKFKKTTTMQSRVIDFGEIKKNMNAST